MSPGWLELTTQHRPEAATHWSTRQPRSRYPHFGHVDTLSNQLSQFPPGACPTANQNRFTLQEGHLISYATQYGMPATSNMASNPIRKALTPRIKLIHSGNKAARELRARMHEPTISFRRCGRSNGTGSLVSITLLFTRIGRQTIHAGSKD